MKRFDFEDFLSVIFSVIIGFFYGIWKLVVWIFSAIGKLLSDVLKNIYGRVVVGIGGLILLSLVGYLIGLAHR